MTPGAVRISLAGFSKDLLDVVRQLIGDVEADVTTARVQSRGQI